MSAVVSEAVPAASAFRLQHRSHPEKRRDFGFLPFCQWELARKADARNLFQKNASEHL